MVVPQLATLCYVRKDDHTLMLHRIKKENDILLLESSDTSGISATLAILEISRDDQNG